MKRNRLCLILLCCFSACMAFYHLYIWRALNSPPAEGKGRAAESGKIDAPGPGASVPAGEAAAKDPAPGAESRAVREFERTIYPALRDAIASEAGFDIPIEVDWPSLAAEGWSHLYETAFPKVYFLPILRALKTYAAEKQERKEARSFLKKIVIRNSGRYFSASGISFADGVLVIDHQPQANVDEEEAERADRVLELLLEASGR